MIMLKIIVILIKFCSGINPLQVVTSHIILGIMYYPQFSIYPSKSFSAAQQKINKPKGGLSVCLRQKIHTHRGLVVSGSLTAELEAVRRIFWTENNAFPKVRMHSMYITVIPIYDS